MKAIKIISCCDGHLWYAKNIGHTVVYLGEDKELPVYWSRDNGGYKNIVYRSDAEIVEVPDGKDDKAAA